MALPHLVGQSSAARAIAALSPVATRPTLWPTCRAGMPRPRPLPAAVVCLSTHRSSQRARPTRARPPAGSHPSRDEQRPLDQMTAPRGGKASRSPSATDSSRVRCRPAGTGEKAKQLAGHRSRLRHCVRSLAHRRPWRVLVVSAWWKLPHGRGECVGHAERCDSGASTVHPTMRAPRLVLEQPCADRDPSVSFTRIR